LGAGIEEENLPELPPVPFLCSVGFRGSVATLAGIDWSGSLLSGRGGGGGGSAGKKGSQYPVRSSSSKAPTSLPLSPEAASSASSVVTRSSA